MPYLNQVILLGHAGGEPKIQFGKDGNTKIVADKVLVLGSKQ